jgi:alpha-1,3-glucanase-like protein/pectate lyase-like protein
MCGEAASRPAVRAAPLAPFRALRPSTPTAICRARELTPSRPADPPAACDARQRKAQHPCSSTTSAANAFDLHYAVPQSASGTLSVYVNGNKLSQQLSLTSAYSYITTGNILGSKAHKMYDDVRMMLRQTVNAGGTVRFQVDSGNTATPYTINVADFFNVGAALTQPANSISVTSQGADPTRVKDSATAFCNAISAANSAGESVWIPPGTYLIGSAIQTSKATIEGAGYWYSQLKTNAGYTFTTPANTVTVTFPAATVRYVKLTFTANTAWPAGQLSELQVYAS